MLHPRPQQTTTKFTRPHTHNRPALAIAMLQRAVQAKVPFRRVAADEVYGDNPALRSCLTGLRLSYVLAIG
ncbi:transposase [Streptomyces sp. C10-9-1]|nr:transposase [Streptomyces sp. C10-9-1]